MCNPIHTPQRERNHTDTTAAEEKQDGGVEARGSFAWSLIVCLLCGGWRLAGRYKLAMAMTREPLLIDHGRE